LIGLKADGVRIADALSMSPFPRRRRLAMAAPLLILLCAACATERRPTQLAAASLDGRGIVERSCAGCHATGPAGTSRDRRAPAFRDLARQRSDAELGADLAEISRHGHVQMPPIYVTPDEQRQILAYLRGLRDRAEADSRLRRT
jgi:mono/diheme cytochrome c family protein